MKIGFIILCAIMCFTSSCLKIDEGRKYKDLELLGQALLEALNSGDFNAVKGYYYQEGEHRKMKDMDIELLSTLHNDNVFNHFDVYAADEYKDAVEYPRKFKDKVVELNRDPEWWIVVSGHEKTDTEDMGTWTIAFPVILIDDYLKAPRYNLLESG